jgi:hypothetical protein
MFDNSMSATLKKNKKTFVITGENVDVFVERQ